MHIKNTTNTPVSITCIICLKNVFITPKLLVVSQWVAEELDCGVSLKSLQEDEMDLVDVSSVDSEQPGVTEAGLFLFQYQAWCALERDTQPFIMVSHFHVVRCNACRLVPLSVPSLVNQGG